MLDDTGTGVSGRSWRKNWPPWRRRMVLFTLPIHLVVFAAIYLGAQYLLSRELIAAHKLSSKLVLRTAISELHLVMPGNAAGTRPRLGSYVDAHRALDLHLYDPEGDLLAGEPLAAPLGHQEPEDVAALLRHNQEEQFWLAADADRSYIRGLIKVRAGPSCLPCHVEGEVRAVASMTLDLTTHLDDFRRRLALYVGTGIALWIALALVVNRVMAQAVSRSMTALKRRISDAEDGEPAAARGLGLDPMSKALFDSFRRSLERQRRHEEDLATRLHHADRLASLGQMAAGLAHEIKNPLAGIQGVLEILRDEADEGGAQRELYGQMLNELKRVDTTIRTLLRFARPRELHRSEVSLRDLLEDTVQLLRPGLVRRNISLDLETAADLGTFPLDGEQIRQVLVNLVNNSAEAIEEDPSKIGGRVVLRATSFPAGDGIIIAVEDNGPGIPEEMQESVFQPFFSTKFSGTGLGLAVAASIVSKHGGRIEVESRRGEGTTFFLALPKVDVSPAPELDRS